MRVRQLYGSRAGEIVEMPYLVAVRAIASGTVEDLAPLHSVPVTGPAVAHATQAAPAAVDTSPRPPRRGRHLGR
jgi:uncharacterized protein (DUF58 family)